MVDHGHTFDRSLSSRLKTGFFPPMAEKRVPVRVLIEFEKRPLLFDDPQHIISCHDPAGLSDAFQQIETRLNEGYFLAGFLSYEAGYGLEEKLRHFSAPTRFPLVCMGCFKQPQTIKKGVSACSEQRAKKGADPFFRITHARPAIERAVYDGDIAAIRSLIAAGDVYQITYCHKMLFECAGSIYALYRQLLKEQPVPYPAYIEAPPFTIASLSPEMFLKKTGSHITTKPMKGTWPRGSNWLDDWRAGWRLHCDEKNRAENLMIADLMRNDLSRIGRNVRTPRLFEVAGYTTLFQMTSTVTATIDPGISFYALMRALFPSGSVTGTPKIRAMEVIRDLEAHDRHIYTGAIGYITPQRDMFFNIPIRTLLVENGQGEMGIGGGIVWDSTADGEWAEGVLKARFLTALAEG